MMPLFDVIIAACWRPPLCYFRSVKRNEHMLTVAHPCQIPTRNYIKHMQSILMQGTCSELLPQFFSQKAPWNNTHTNKNNNTKTNKPGFFHNKKCNESPITKVRQNQGGALKASNKDCTSEVKDSGADHTSKSLRFSCRGCFEKKRVSVEFDCCWYFGVITPKKNQGDSFCWVFFMNNLIDTWFFLWIKKWEGIRTLHHFWLHWLMEICPAPLIEPFADG